MASLETSTDYLETLMMKVRGVMGRTAPAYPDRGSNPTDDEAGAGLEDSAADLSDDEVAMEIRGLSERQQSELVALLWLGRGDAEPEEWDDLIARARREVTLPADQYLLGQPLLAEHWAEGLSRLGIAPSSSTTELQ
jgi:hypothetical protein